MKQSIKSLIKDILALGNAYPTSLTDKNDLQALLCKLYPMHPGKELIRLGPKGDGGYLVADDLAGIEACFSPGVGQLSSFERDCADLGMKVFMADKSVEQPVGLDNRFQFISKYVGITTNDDFMTVDNWVASSLPASQSDLMLQMDIEGYEYEVFMGMSDNLMSRFRIIAAEFHDLGQLWNRPFFQLASRAFEKILQTHTCIHIHPNNGCGVLNKGELAIPIMSEFTFLRKDRLHNPAYATVFPHPLDHDTTTDPHIPLPACWYYHGN